MSRKLGSGYVYVSERGEMLDAILSEREQQGAKFIGSRMIDGMKFGVFKVGRRMVYQLWQNTEAGEPRAVGRRRCVGKACKVTHRVEHVVNCPKPRGTAKRPRRRQS